LVERGKRALQPFVLVNGGATQRKSLTDLDADALEKIRHRGPFRRSAAA
jgi:hypothetical protein